MLTAPGAVSFDLSLSRTFRFLERWQLEARIEVFNVINHPCYSTPSTTLSSSTFGVITSTVASAKGGREQCGRSSHPAVRHEAAVLTRLDRAVTRADRR